VEQLSPVLSRAAAGGLRLRAFRGRWLGARGQLLLHAALLLAPLALLPLAAPSASPPRAPGRCHRCCWRSPGSVGLPFFVLATSSSMVQKWHALRSGESPYFLYAASNVGSFAALLAYPFIVEPALGARAQLRLWSLGYLGFVALTTVALIRAWRVTPSTATIIDTTQVPPVRRLRWLIRAAVPSSLLSAVSLAITTDVAAIPLLWVLPLGLYLASFVVAFWPRFFLSAARAGGAGRDPDRGGPLAPVAGKRRAAASARPAARQFCSSAAGSATPTWRAIALSPSRSRQYYLWIAAGGFAGGVFGNLIAPLLFNSVAEYPLSLALVAMLLNLAAAASPGCSPRRASRRRWSACSASCRRAHAGGAPQLLRRGARARVERTAPSRARHHHARRAKNRRPHAAHVLRAAEPLSRAVGCSTRARALPSSASAPDRSPTTSSPIKPCASTRSIR